MVPENTTGTIDCACVIHGDAYSWEYVDRLYSMLSRHISRPIRLHVYTEANRTVPAPYIKHSLFDWKISGPKKAWWYKMQLFNSKYHSGPLLYFDLDVVIVNNIDWIWQLPTTQFWTVRDFKYLWKPSNYSVNSSIMYWDTKRFKQVWNNFKKQQFGTIISSYRGDQDYITEVIAQQDLRFFDIKSIQSWRWQALDGGYNFGTRRYFTPGTGTKIAPDTSVLVFHGNPKPDAVQDPAIINNWR